MRYDWLMQFKREMGIQWCLSRLGAGLQSLSTSTSVFERVQLKAGHRQITRLFLDVHLGGLTATTTG